MSQRGRGCFEIRPPTSAFYRTSTSEIGDEIIRTTDIVDISESSERQAASTATQSFSFLYTRESDKIGSKVRNDAIDNNPHFSAVACQRRQNRARNMIDENETCETIKIPELTTEQVLATYKQGSKVEDPRFTTSANDYGE